MKPYMKYIQPGIFLVVLVAAFVVSLQKASPSATPKISNDEKNWTAVSISSYEMYFNGYQRRNPQLDSWFYTYAIENGIDTAAMSPDEKQWYDFAMWTFGWKAPNLGKYIIGKYVVATAGTEVDKEGYYEKGRPELQEDTKIYYSRVPDELVYRARQPNAIMNALGIVMVFLTGWLFLNYWSGFMASMYLLLNGTYQKVNTAVGLDSPSLLFWILAVFFLIATIRFIFKNEKLWKTLLLALGTGVMFAFAVSSKLNAAMFGYVCVFVFPLAAVAIFWARKPEKGVPFLKTAFGSRLAALLLSGAIIAIVGPVLFVKLNPQVQGDTRAKIKVVQLSVDEFFKRRANSQISKNRQARKVITEVTYNKPGKALNLVIRRNFVVDNPELYNGTFGKLLNFKGNFLDGLFLVIGLAALLWMGFQKFRKEKKLNGEWIILISFIVMLYGMADFIWIDFTRYHMAIYPGMALAIGYGLYVLGDFIVKKVNAKKAVKG